MLTLAIGSSNKAQQKSFGMDISKRDLVRTLGSVYDKNWINSNSFDEIVRTCALVTGQKGGELKEPNCHVTAALLNELKYREKSPFFNSNGKMEASLLGKAIIDTLRSAHEFFRKTRNSQEIEKWIESTTKKFTKISHTEKLEKVSLPDPPIGGMSIEVLNQNPPIEFYRNLDLINKGASLTNMENMPWSPRGDYYYGTSDAEYDELLKAVKRAMEKSTKV